MANKIAMRVVLENMVLRSPLGFFDVTRAAQQESIEGAAPDAMLNRVLVERDVCRWAGSGFRIASCSSAEEDVLGRPVASQPAIAFAGLVACAPGEFSLAFVIINRSIKRSAALQVLFPVAS
jgi:hypothetical protein